MTNDCACAHTLDFWITTIASSNKKNDKNLNATGFDIFFLATIGNNNNNNNRGKRKKIIGYLKKPKQTDRQSQESLAYL